MGVLSVDSKNFTAVKCVYV